MYFFIRIIIISLVIFVNACSFKNNPEPIIVEKKQEKVEPKFKKQTPKKQATKLYGGWTRVEKATPEVFAAAKLALAEIASNNYAELSSIENIEQQVVNGMNYRFQLNLSNKKSYFVQVHRSLDGEYMVQTVQEIVN